MISLRTSLLVALCMAVTACAQMNPRDDATAAGIDTSDRQILVMLRAPPPHFRPYIDDTPSYDARVPQGGQRRIAEDLAQRYDLKLVTDWPMPALGVDCFVLEAPSREAIARLVDEIARDARVESAQAMYVFHVLAHNDPLYPLQPSARLWHLAEVHKITTGRDVRIAEVDTGVEVDHPDLRGRVAVARDFVGIPAPRRRGARHRRRRHHRGARRRWHRHRRRRARCEVVRVTRVLAATRPIHCDVH